MDGQNIPGFYWDPEKKKYFKIQSANAARDLNLRYSAANIRKTAREERLQKTVDAQNKKIRKQRVVRRHASNLIQTCVEREIGFRNRSYHMHNLWPNACIAGLSAEPHVVITQHAPSSHIRLFDRDPISKTVYAVHGENVVKRRRIDPGRDLPLPGPCLDEDEYFKSFPFNRYSFEPWDELGRTTSTVSSLCYLPATGALAVTTVGSDRPPVVQLSDPERDGPYVSQQFTPKNCTAIWGAAARPTTFTPSPGVANSIAASHVEHLAVAASSSMLLFTRSQAGVWDSAMAVDHLDSDILALDWISYTTLALGCRNGKIHLHDTRSGGSSHVLTHPNSVSRLKRADDATRLVCSGLEDTLFLYDIRASKIMYNEKKPRTQKKPSSFIYNAHHYNEQYFKNMYPEAQNDKKRRRMEHTACRKWSQPVLSFPHVNIDDIGLDMDVHASLGLVAAAEDVGSTGVAIRVSNLWTGRTVKEFKTSPSRNGNQNRGKYPSIRALKFMDPDIGDGGNNANIEIWTTWDGGIARFGW